jgi:hypothetical protein
MFHRTVSRTGTRFIKKLAFLAHRERFNDESDRTDGLPSGTTADRARIALAFAASGQTL